MNTQSELKELSVKSLEENFTSVIRGIEYAQSFYPTWPKKPEKPTMPSNPTAKQAKKYAGELEAYEELIEFHKKEAKAYQDAKNHIDKIIEDYIKEQSGLNTIPEQYRDKVYALAWEDGHSCGYSEVYSYLCRLVEIF